MKSIANIYKMVTEHFDSDKTVYIEDELDGKAFGHPDMMYHLELNFMYHIVDDSDYDRETGYGRNRYPEYEETVSFDIEEIDKDGNTVRTDKEIEKDEPKLYKDLLEYAKEQALADIND